MEAWSYGGFPLELESLSWLVHIVGNPCGEGLVVRRTKRAPFCFLALTHVRTTWSVFLSCDVLL